jgi:ribosomal protein S18 acetylase RimI-like enzyme
MDRYHLTRTLDNDGYLFEIREVKRHDPQLISALTELDLLTYSEPTFSRFTLGAFLRHGRVFLAMADELVIGACHCLRDFERPAEVVVFNMALRPGWRGHGLGTRFMAGLLSLLKQQGVSAVQLQVAENNERAIWIYREKFGFEHVTVHPNEFHNGQSYRLMRLDLGRYQPRPLGGES